MLCFLVTIHGVCELHGWDLRSWKWEWPPYRLTCLPVTMERQGGFAIPASGKLLPREMCPQYQCTEVMYWRSQSAQLYPRVNTKIRWCNLWQLVQIVSHGFWETLRWGTCSQVRASASSSERGLVELWRWNLTCSGVHILITHKGFTVNGLSQV